MDIQPPEGISRLVLMARLAFYIKIFSACRILSGSDI
jgi:hypothetical protein